MKRPVVAVAAATVAAVLAAAGFAGCGDGDGDDPRQQLADRVQAALAADPQAVVDRLEQLDVDATTDDVEGVDLTCPRVTDPAPGDLATCDGEIAGVQVAVDVEFGEGDDLTVVLVEVRP